MHRNVGANLLFAFVLSMASLQGALITTQAVSGNVLQGGSDSVVAGVSGVTGTDVAEYDLNIIFDPNVLSFVSVDFGDPVLGDELNLFGYGSSLGVNAGNAATGTVEVYESSFDSPQDLASYQPDSFGLFTVNFSARNDGYTQVTSQSISLGDGLGDDILSGYGPPASIYVQSPTPEPSTVSLLVVGIGLGTLLRRRR